MSRFEIEYRCKGLVLTGSDNDPVKVYEFMRGEQEIGYDGNGHRDIIVTDTEKGTRVSLKDLSDYIADELKRLRGQPNDGKTGKKIRAVESKDEIIELTDAK
jgi:hypothetical protein